MYYPTNFDFTKHTDDIMLGSVKSHFNQKIFLPISAGDMFKINGTKTNDVKYVLFKTLPKVTLEMAMRELVQSTITYEGKSFCPVIQHNNKLYYGYDENHLLPHYDQEITVWYLSEKDKSGFLVSSKAICKELSDLSNRENGVKIIGLANPIQTYIKLKNPKMDVNNLLGPIFWNL